MQAVAFESAASNAAELAMALQRKGMAAKRARLAADEEDDVIVPGKVAEAACPAQMEKEDFDRLQTFVARFRGDPYLSLLPMPPAAYDALGVPKPQVASAMDAAVNCLMKTSSERYTSHEVEVRDLSKTLTEKDFPTFYEGPSHPHTLPEGGIRVIPHAVEEEAASASGGAGAGPLLTDASEAASAGEPRGAGAGAGSRAMLTDE
jgi:hypothetical protein